MDKPTEPARLPANRAGPSRAEVAARISDGSLDFVRLAWGDPYGYSRAKLVTPEAALEALEDGFNTNMATTTLDGSGARSFAAFTRGGGMGIEQMTGSPSQLIRPDPATFRVLPWEPRIGWMLCDEHFLDGSATPFSPRALLKRELARLAERGIGMTVGLEIEFYLLDIAEHAYGLDHVGEPGRRGRPLATTPMEPGYHYHSETNLDILQPLLSALGAAYTGLGLPLRSIEKEWGPGQVEVTFGPTDALTAADNVALFRTATRQVARRNGAFATFMAMPAFPGFYASGWHLHQSLTDLETGKNLLAGLPGSGADLSALGRAYLGGLLANGPSGAIFAAPTVTGYRRFRPNSLAPDRATWGPDHRGVMLRTLGSAGSPATRIENRVGEPAANPYLFIASQIAAGLDGIDRALDPGPPDLEPYSADRPRLPPSLGAAIEAARGSPVYRDAFGAQFMDYYLALKTTELGRYEASLAATGETGEDRPTQWEQYEYFDFF